MTHDDVPHVAHYLLEKYNLAQQGWTFCWDSAKRSAGQCDYRNKKISLSRHYVTLNVTTRPDRVIDTILHEIAHALAGWRAFHGTEWRAACERIGARPERCIQYGDVTMPEGRFVATCGGCRTTYSRHKKMMDGRTRYCKACGPERGALVYEDTSSAGATPATTTDPPTPRRMRSQHASSRQN